MFRAGGPWRARPVRPQQQRWGAPQLPPDRAAPPLPPPTRVGPFTLRALCLGVLGEYLEELIELGEEVLPRLPGELKASLLAVARLRRLLSDTALVLLAGDGDILDLHDAGASLSDAGIRAALCLMPQLRQADLRGCPVSPSTLRTLGEACTWVTILRLGGHDATDHAPGMGAALKAVLPGLDKGAAAAVDSWEDQLEPRALVGQGRLMHLQCLVWPRMPFKLQQYCGAACPAVVLNPTPADVRQQGLPPDFSPDCRLDTPLLNGELVGSGCFGKVMWRVCGVGD